MPDEPHAVVLDPRAEPRESTTASPTYAVDGPILGKVVGIRLDEVWRSFAAIVEEWRRLLVADGAIPKILWVGERMGPEGERTRSDLDEWSRLIDIGVVGLGN